jgi:CarD family transcriptional regulator
MSAEKFYDFEIGEKAVYPCHGVGTIENIEACNVGGADQDFYVLKIHSTGAKVMVPTRAAKTVGLRSVVNTFDVEKVYQILKAPSAKKSTSTWNRRYRTLTDKLNTGNLVEIAEVLRDLSSLSGNKELSFGEKKMLERARNMLVSEISVAREEEKNVIELELNGILLSV